MSRSVKERREKEKERETERERFVDNEKDYC